MPGGFRQVLIHSEISFLRLSVGCEANHFSASLAVATSCRAASMAASASSCVSWNRRAMTSESGSLSCVRVNSGVWSAPMFRSM